MDKFICPAVGTDCKPGSDVSWRSLSPLSTERTSELCPKPFHAHLSALQHEVTQNTNPCPIQSPMQGRKSRALVRSCVSKSCTCRASSHPRLSSESTSAPWTTCSSLLPHRPGMIHTMLAQQWPTHTSALAKKNHFWDQHHSWG